MDIDQFRQSIRTRVFHIHPERKTFIHVHPMHNEVFYCVKGAGIGVIDDREVPLSEGNTIVVPAGTPHVLKTDTEMYVASFLIPPPPESP